jgi:hypothetical protein
LHVKFNSGSGKIKWRQTAIAPRFVGHRPSMNKAANCYRGFIAAPRAAARDLTLVLENVKKGPRSEFFGAIYERGVT